MHKYKFYYLRDKSKETMHIFDAPNIEEAYIIASNIKQLSVEEFKKLFGIAKSK